MTRLIPRRSTVTECDQQAQRELRRLQVRDDLSYMDRGKRLHRLELDDKAADELRDSRVRAQGPSRPGRTHSGWLRLAPAVRSEKGAL